MQKMKKLKKYPTGNIGTKTGKYVLFIAILMNCILMFASNGWSGCDTVIGDRIWEDLNEDGYQDIDEPGIAYVKVILKSYNIEEIEEEVVDSTVTDTEGYYSFTNHCPGDYIVEVVESTLAQGLEASPCSVDPDPGTPGNDIDSNCNSQALTLGYDEKNETIDFGYYEEIQCVGSIGDYIWIDANRDGEQAGEQGLQGVTVQLLDDQGAVVATDITDATGQYQFDQLCAGDYEVVVDENSAALAGFEAIAACSSDADPGTAGNGTDTNCSPQLVTLPFNDSQNPSIDFGYVPLCTGTIGDYIWHDVDWDGVQSSADRAIAGITVQLLDDQGAVIATDITDATGQYQFDQLCAGDYEVVVDENSPVLAGFEAITTCSSDADPGTAGNGTDSNCSPQMVILSTNNTQNLTIDFGYIADCGECSGKVTQLTLQYNGNALSYIEVTQKKGGLVFAGYVSPGEEFTFTGTDKKGTLGTEIRIYVDGSLNTKIHTSCSKPIGIGLAFGSFEVTDGYSRNGGRLCPVSGGGDPGSGNCSECDGKVIQLTLQYNGNERSFVEVTQKKGGLVFAGYVSPGEEFTFTGTDKKGTLGTEIRIYVDGSLNTKIHTSCSKPIGIGLAFGSFEVTDGYSRNGGRLCPVSGGGDPGSGNCSECDGKVIQLTLQYNGNALSYIEVTQKKGGLVFAGYVSPGEEFTFTGTDKKGTLGTEIRIYVDGSLNTKIHTSCSKPIGIGLTFGSFEVTDGYSRNGGRFCSVDGGDCCGDCCGDCGDCGGDSGCGGCSDCDSGGSQPQP